MEGIEYWIESEGNGHWFFVAFPMVLLCLFIWFKNRRVHFLVPSLIISLVIINPWFYTKWTELGLYAYWRILWIIPVIPVIAALVSSVAEIVLRLWLKAILTVICIGTVVFSGTFLYNGAGGTFVDSVNASKLPDYVIQIADRLLELNNHPRVIVQNPLGVYIRQYSGDIDTLYGRDIEGTYIYLPTKEAVQANRAINNEDNLGTVSRLMLDDNYDYLVMKTRSLADNSLEIVESIGDYSIYRPIGVPSVLKERNELGQVVSVTTLDDNGNPRNNSYGYATLHQEYDIYGNKTQRWYTDAGGDYCFQRAGHVRIEEQWDGDSLLSRTYMDKNSNPVMRNDGYSKVKWVTDENGVVNVVFLMITGMK